MKIQNTFKPLTWNSHGTTGATAEVDPDVFSVSSVLIVSIDEDVQTIIDQYDTAREQDTADKYAFIVVWEDGEWQPRSTHPIIDEAIKAADDWWFDFTTEISRKRHDE